MSERLPSDPQPSPARCGSCAAWLAADQRYCLACGAPRSRLGGWAWAADDAPSWPRETSAAGFRSRMPAPRATGLLAIVLLGIGTFIGGAFGPHPEATQADASDQGVIVVAGSRPSAPPKAPSSSDASQAGAPDDSSPELTAGGGTARQPDRVTATPAGSGDAAISIAQEPGPEPAPSDPLPGDRDTPRAAAPALPPVKHVFTVVLSGRAFDQLFVSGPPAGSWARSLAARGALLPDYTGVARGALAGRVALISGQAPTPEIRADCPTYADLLPGTLNQRGQAIGRGCVAPRPVQTVADQFDAKGLAWRAYLQGMDAPGQSGACRHPVLGGPEDTLADRPSDHYATASNPFVYFHSIIDTAGCNANVVSLPRLTADLSASATTPAFAFISPDRCHDGRDPPCGDGQAGGVAAAEAFLRQWVPAIQRSPAYRRGGLLVITADATPDGGRVGALLLSRYARAGKTVRTRYNHYALLRTVEDLFSLSHLAHAADGGVKPFGSDVFLTARSQ